MPPSSAVTEMLAGACGSGVPPRWALTADDSVDFIGVLVRFYRDGQALSIRLYTAAVRPAFLTTENFANPYPLGQWLRDHDPVHWSTEFHAWLLTRYADVSACLHDPRLASDRVPPVEQMGKSMEPLRPLFRTMRRMFLYRDAPEHTRMRRAVHQTFTRASIERWRTEIQRLVRERLDEIDGQPEADLLSALARPLPINVIRMVLGIPAEAAAQLEIWSEDVSRFVGNFSHPPDRLASIQKSILEFSDFLRTQVEERRRGRP